MTNKKCCICGRLTLTLSEAIRYRGNDDVSILGKINKKRICVSCAVDIRDVLEAQENSGYSASKETAKKSIPNELRWSVLERDNFTCKKCGSRRNLHCDHIHPESKGGEATLENLQTLCAHCNKSKGNR